MVHLRRPNKQPAASAQLAADGQFSERRHGLRTGIAEM